MLFKRHFVEGIKTGTITRTYRNWKRPQVAVGNHYNLNPSGVIEVEQLTEIPLASVSDRDARCAGFNDRSSLCAQFRNADPETVYRVDFSFVDTGRVRQPETKRLAGGDARKLLERLDKCSTPFGERPSLEKGSE